MKRILFSFLLITSSSAIAADWKYVGSATQDNGDYYMDASSFKYDVKSKVATVWTKTDNYKTPPKYSTIPEDTEAASKLKVEYYCGLRKTKILSGVWYGESGRVLRQVEPQNQRSRDVIPDTIGEAMFEAACTNPTKGLSISGDTQSFILSKLKYYNNPYKPYPNLQDFDTLEAYYEGVKDWFDLPGVIPQKYINKYGNLPDMAKHNTFESWEAAIKSYYNQIKIDIITGK